MDTTNGHALCKRLTPVLSLELLFRLADGIPHPVCNALRKFSSSIIYLDIARIEVVARQPDRLVHDIDHADFEPCDPYSFTDKSPVFIH
jgi:hypothetical protein